MAGGKVADFVEEERSAFGLLDAAHAAEKGPGEGPLFVAEELALQKAFAERGTIDLHEGLLRPQAIVVDGRCHELLAGARFAPDEHRRAGRGDLVDPQIDLAHAMRVADDVFRPESLFEGVAESQVLRLQHLPLRFFHAARLDVIGDHAGDDFQETASLLELLGVVQGHIDRQRPHDLAAQNDGHAKKRHVRIGFRLPLIKPIGKSRLLEYLGNNGRLAGLHHIADDPLAITISILPLRMPRNARRGGDDQLAPVGRQQHHRAAYQGQPLFQQLEHFGKHLPLAMLRGQESSDLGQDPKILLV